jgi:hypothetical protein
MKVLLGSALVTFLAGVLLVPLFFHPPTLNAAPPQSMAPGANFNCSSDDGRRKYCPADTRGGVQLVYQRSGSACTFNQTWGWDRKGVWVDRGCRADFAIGFVSGPQPGRPPMPGPPPAPPSWPGWGNNYNVYCASDNGGRNRCPVDTRGGVRLVRQRSGSPCSFGSTWGWDRHGVWVDRGCRADFEIGQAGWNPPQQGVVNCSSDDGRRNVCAVNTMGGVRIIRQRSDADCIYRVTWGYDPRGIWVDRGCRADFEVNVPR